MVHGDLVAAAARGAGAVAGAGGAAAPTAAARRRCRPPGQAALERAGGREGGALRVGATVHSIEAARAAFAGAPSAAARWPAPAPAAPARPPRRHSSALLAVAAIFGAALLPRACVKRPALLVTRASISGGNAAAAPVRLAVAAPLDAPSSLGAPWREVLEHTARRLAWTDPGFELAVLDARDAGAPAALAAADVAVTMGVRDAGAAAALAPGLAAAPNALAFDSDAALAGVARVGGRDVDRAAPEGLLARALAALRGRGADFKRNVADAAALGTAAELYSRSSSDDLLFSLLVLINQGGRRVDAVAVSTTSAESNGPAALGCMVTKCGREVFGCLADASCRAALGCLAACRLNDQVCSYRCIASYESADLAAFTLCILTKHDCLGLRAEIPALPVVEPMAAFRGAPLTHEVAEDLLIGWLAEPSSSLAAGRPGADATSWLVFAGKNPAYDAFPNQRQLFFRGKSRGSVWYQPVFQVKTLDGRAVWRDRLYRVRRAAVPGSFHLSVLDNGVVSSEFWRVLDVDEDLGWGAFYYSGAASKAGLSYTGAILTSRDGLWPEGTAARARIVAALERAGILPWELSNVTHDASAFGAPMAPAPVALPGTGVLAAA